MSTIDFDRITHPLVLSSGSHKAGSGRGCAMNVISYIQGDTDITDFPKCSDPNLSRMVQFVNDRLASIQETAVDPDTGYDYVYYLLPPSDAMRTLDIAWQTVGTAGQPPELTVVWIKRILAESTKRFGHLKGVVRECIADAHGYARNGRVDVAATYLLEAVVNYGESELPHEQRLEPLVEFAEYAVKTFREIAGLDTPTVDHIEVSEAIEKMVTV